MFIDKKCLFSTKTCFAKTIRLFIYFLALSVIAFPKQQYPFVVMRFVCIHYYFVNNRIICLFGVNLG